MEEERETTEQRNERLHAYEVGYKAGQAARDGDWARVKHWNRGAPKPSNREAYAEYKRGYSDAQPGRYGPVLRDR